MIYIVGSPTQTRVLKPYVDVSISPFADTIQMFASSRSHSIKVDEGDGKVKYPIWSNFHRNSRVSWYHLTITYCTIIEKHSYLQFIINHVDRFSQASKQKLKQERWWELFNYTRLTVTRWVSDIFHLNAQFFWANRLL